MMRSGSASEEHSDVVLVSLSNMDTFFRRHFKKKEAAPPAAAEVKSVHQRRPSVAIPTSKARRRSNAGLPSSTLSQRRRPSVQLQGAPPRAREGRSAKTARQNRWAGHVRRRSSTTTPNLNPRFAVCRRKVGKLRTIDTHLLGPSMLLASLIQMEVEEEEEEGEGGEEEEGEGARLPAGEQQVEVRGGANKGRMFPRSGSLHLDGDDDSSDYSTANDSQSEASSPSEVEQLVEEEEEDASWSHFYSDPASSSNQEVKRGTPQPPPASRPLIRAPRCLRRNSSQVFSGDAASFSRRRASSHRKRRRISTISKAGSPWPGRGPPLPSRRSSVLYLHPPVLYRGPGALGPLGDSHLESWSSFLLYVDSGFMEMCQPSSRASIKDHSRVRY
ncbi:Diacylglycerol kinase zeta [Liparis tanakae]|uniref:Diacylglycerol kinase zeta n=1 Tax=Liparis tanakae TaxID=230148 RepID=A0A4Z2J0C6_9TELE|nr:Diacylglycerol kinase zeta [Liparis tanakae]